MESSTRQEHIRAATSFLRNPNLDSPLKDKLQFLRDKGLSEIELDEALNLALTCRQSPTKGKWNFFIVFSMCILGYKFYKAYLEWQEASRASGDNADKETSKINQTIVKTTNHNKFRDTGNDSMSITEIMEKMTELKKLIEYQGTRLTDEMQSLKKLLVGPEKFKSPPGLPAWQLEGSTDKVDDQLEEDELNK